MFRFSFTTFASLLLIASLSASDEQKVEVRRDTEFAVEVHGTIKSAAAKVGDTVQFRTEGAVLIGNKMVVPDNSTVLGTITEVRQGRRHYPRSLIRIRIHTLRWKDKEAHLNAIVTSIRHIHEVTDLSLASYVPTFLEGVRVVSHLQREASTEFLSDHKEITIRGGVRLAIRQVDPDDYPDQLRTLSANTQEAAKN